ncbi:MAG: cation:proton antiporter, partial [Pirellulaceae bacterium]
MTPSLINDLLMILAAGLVASLVCRRLHVSVLIGYLVVGAILGQGVLGWVLDEDHQLEHFAEAGVFLLLFSIGLEFSIDDLKRLGRNLIIGGATQMILVAVPVALVLIKLEMNWQSACLIAAAFAFSSTVLVFKALSEWGQSQKTHGRRAIGILLFQDAALVPLLLLVPLLTGSETTPGIVDYLKLSMVAFSFVISVIGIRFALSRWLIPMLAGYRSPELV